MNATANSGSRPDEQLAMIEIVPVGAIVVTLQLRSSCIGRMRWPSLSRAGFVRPPDRARPLGERAALMRQTLALALGLGVDEGHELPPEVDRILRVVRQSEADERIGKAHDPEADPADPL